MKSTSSFLSRPVIETVLALLAEGLPMRCGHVLDEQAHLYGIIQWS